MRLKTYNILLIVLLVFSCATNKTLKTTQVTRPTSSENFFLPGLDSSVVKNAVQFSDRIIVDYKRRELADRLYQKGENSFQKAESIWNHSGNENNNDSSFVQIYENGIQTNDASSQHTRWSEEIKPDKINHVCLAILDSAYKAKKN